MFILQVPSTTSPSPSIGGGFLFAVSSFGRRLLGDNPAPAGPAIAGPITYPPPLSATARRHMINAFRIMGWDYSSGMPLPGPSGFPEIGGIPLITRPR